MTFPIDVSSYKPVALDPGNPALSAADREQLTTNINLVRDTILFFTAVSGAKGLSGHTGGAYSITPEVLIADSFMNGSDTVYPVCFDEAGHRVAIQYALAAFKGDIPFERLLHYREFDSGLWGHPEREQEGLKFSSGRLGHMWAYVNGVAMAHPDKTVFLFGSDGAQMEGNDAEAARFAVARQLNVKVVVDDNNVTISGHPSDYLPGFDVARTLEGHGLTVDKGAGEDWDVLFTRMQKAVATPGPVAVVNQRLMAPGVPGIEGTHAGHEVVGKDAAIEYLTARGHTGAADYLKNLKPEKSSAVYLGSSDDVGSNRTEFGKIVNGILDRMGEDDRKARVLVVDSDLEGSTGLKGIRQEHPEVCVNGGVQERGNFSVAAGFGYEPGKQGIFSTFSAFLEMIVSEATMARLNWSNAICHFSHAGVDDIADNTCHFGINVFLAHCGLAEYDDTRLYMPADALQLKSLVETVWSDKGLRFIFTTRSKVPYILKEDGEKYYGDSYQFVPGMDEVIREGSAGYVVSYGEMLYRALDAVEKARKEGIDVGLINKPTLNIVDESTMKKVGAAPFVIVVEGQNLNTGLGMRYGTWLLERGYSPKYGVMAVTRPGKGGTSEQIPHQGLAPDHILEKVKGML